MITETPTPSPITPEPQARARQRTRVWVGGIVALVGAVIVLAGAALLAVFGSDGTLTTGRHAVTTPTSALVSESAKIGHIADGAQVFGRPSVHISTDPGVFIGVGRADDVEAYLADVEHEVVTDIEDDPFELSTERRAGTGTATPPAAQDIWVEQGTSKLDWELRRGDYRVVMMNPDGSPDLRTHGRFGIEIPHLPALAGGLMGLGLLVLLGGGILALRRP